MEKKHLTEKISLLTSKVNVELKKKFVTYYVWGIALYDSETWTLKKLERKYLGTSKCTGGERRR